MRNTHSKHAASHRGMFYDTFGISVYEASAAARAVERWTPWGESSCPG